ncbi:MAG TPA: hypothetical protein VGG74_21855 [Kofleriaceae bacterium]|jgi:hypothetical protein
MPHDLEDELLRAAVALCDCDAVDAVDLAELQTPRLAHALLATAVVGAAARLVAGGWLERAGDRYAPTERARAYLAREPELLMAPRGEPELEITRPDVPLPPDVAAR